MKNLLIVILCISGTSAMKGQEILFHDINSSNILALYDRVHNAQVNPGNTSFDTIAQRGVGNRIEVIDKSPNFLQIVQSGNYNTVNYINPNDYPTNAQIMVNGSGNYIDIAGSNSISDGMKMNINASDMTIFMRNY